MKNKGSHAGHWKTRRAMRIKSLRQANSKGDDSEYSRIGSTGSRADLEVYENDEAQKLGSIGILAELNPPKFTLLHDKRFILGKAETDYQLDLLDQLAIGDNVIFALEAENPVIKGITVRRSKLARLRMDTSKKSALRAEEHIIAANIDIAVIVASTIQPLFNPNLVDRYLVISQYGNVSPLLCITKTDLAKAPDLSMYESTDLPVVKVSNVTKDGVDKLLPYIKGKICVMIGSSGVGKSSLINSLLGEELLLTDEVGRKSGKGTHTTSTTSLHLLGESTMLIDTPGIRSLGMWGIDKDSLRLYYPEFAEFSQSCKFRDCTHSHEPGCAVKKAVEEGLIRRDRYDSYIRLLMKE